MKTRNILIYLSILIGAGMLIGTFFICKNTSQFIEKAIITQGTVVEIFESYSNDSEDYDITYYPLIEFTDAYGTQIEFESFGSNPPRYSVNEMVEVIYDPEYPDIAEINDYFSLWGGATILGIFGFVIFSIGGSFFAYDMKKKSRLKYLKKNGKKIETKFKSVIINTSYEVNGENPFIVFTHWRDPETAKLHIFKSDHIWFDPTDYIITDKINVLIDRENPKKYWVDLSFLPKVA